MGATILLSLETSIPLPFLRWNWLHVCVALACRENRISTAVNGVEINVEKTFPEGTVCLKSLMAGNLVLGKVVLRRGTWNEANGMVTNLNIYSGTMTPAEMVVRTSGGEGCAKQDGDYLSWSDASWRLEGITKWTEVSEADLCRQYSDIQTFTTQVVERPSDCRQLCSKVHKKARIPSVQTPELVDKLGEHMQMVEDLSGSYLFIVWLSMSKENGLWVDSYTKEEIVDPNWKPGYPVNDSSKACAFNAVRSPGYVNWPCLQTGAYGGWYCTCQFPEPPFLALRGLCPDSHLDRIFMPYNSPHDAETTYYGNRVTVARYLKDANEWTMEALLYNTTATSKEISKRFMLGKQNWTIEGDSKKCADGETYTDLLKLTGCTEGEFTCDDGQCVEMEQRCNQESDCRDESDELRCKLIIFKESYNKNIPPITKEIGKKALPANVSISITLMKVVEIEEVDHSIHLQFQISLSWKENRVKYHNLKKEVSLNALTERDISSLWLPLIVYDNTDQKEVTRLGVEWEWTTVVTVTRNLTANFSRSGLDQVDEAEIFEGAEHKLTMEQMYTWEFQCKYKLQRYPFDTQVHQ